MAAPVVGKRAGTMHVRVLPNTKHFPRELKKQLDRIEKSMPALKVQVSKAEVHTAKIQRSIQAQLARIRDLKVDVEAQVVSKRAIAMIEKLASDRKMMLLPQIDQTMLERITKQVERSVKSIEATLKPTFDDEAVRARVNELTHEMQNLERDLHISVLNEEEKLRIRHRIHEISESLDDMAKDRTVRVDVNPFTAWAAGRLAWLTRPRIVEIIPRVSKAALAKAVTALTALSGARLSFDYLKRFSDWMSEIDKKLPSLAFGALGVSTAFSGVMGAISGIVGIGDGLAATLPSLLLLPGLLAGAALSAVTLGVALKDAKTELEVLGDSYTNLGSIIKTGFWEEARQPIIELSDSIMPQLERSFERTSNAIGKFTGDLAKSFQTEFAGGRLEAMFSGLAESWAELSKGTDAFAGAITNLGLVAARYMPRLAAWFVRQANTFDNWLSAVATDGRLDTWIAESIDSFYALWDVMAATTGIFQGLWKAAESAGSGGLRGFADTLLAWERAINGAKWQATLESMFRGAGVAMSGFSDGLERVGNMLYEQRDALEHFMGTAGEALGGFVGAIADALASPEVAVGLEGFIDGVASGLESLEPALGPAAEAFGRLADFAGGLAESFGPVLQSAITTVSDIVSGFLSDLDKSDAVERLSKAFKDFLEGETGESLESIAETIGDDLAPALVKLAESGLPALSQLVNLIAPLANGSVEKASEAIDGFADSIKGVQDIFGQFSGESETAIFTPEWVQGQVDSLSQWMGLINPIFFILDDLGLSFGDVGRAIGEFTATAQQKMSEFTLLVSAGITSAVAWFTSLPARIQRALLGASSWLVAKGAEIVNGLQAGVFKAWISLSTWFSNLQSKVTGFFAGVSTWLIASGASLLQGFADGVMSKLGAVKDTIAGALSSIRGAFPFSPAKWGPFSGRGWVSYAGESVGSTFGSSLVQSIDRSRARVARSLAGVQSEFASLSGDMSRAAPISVRGQFDVDRNYAARITKASATSLTGGSMAPAGMNVTANFLQPDQREQFREFAAVLARIRR